MTIACFIFTCRMRPVRRWRRGYGRRVLKRCTWCKASRVDRDE